MDCPTFVAGRESPARIAPFLRLCLFHRRCRTYDRLRFQIVDGLLRRRMGAESVYDATAIVTGDDNRRPLQTCRHFSSVEFQVEWRDPTRLLDLQLLLVGASGYTERRQTTSVRSQAHSMRKWAFEHLKWV
jgi:hypothetical protein